MLDGGPAAELLCHGPPHGRDGDHAGRYLAALHRLVLQRRAPRLALHYPTVGGTPDLRTVHVEARRLAAERRDELAAAVADPRPTDDVAHCAALLVGQLGVARATGLPLRLLEVGTPAGLHLRADRYAYLVPDGVGGRRRLGPDRAEVVLADHLAAPLPLDPRTLPRVVSRRGCDPSPLDPTTAEGRLRLSSAVWADRTDRFALLAAALRTAAATPAEVDRARAGTWLAGALADAAPGTATVVQQVLVHERLDTAEAGAVTAALEDAGARASTRAPVAHLALEPDGEHGGLALTVRCWPDAPTPRVVGRAAADGTAVRPAA